MALFQKNGHTLSDNIKRPRFVAASLKVNFLKPTPQGVQLKAIGVVTEIHPKRFKVNSELFAGDVLCATSNFEGVIMPKTFLDKDKA